MGVQALEIMAEFDKLDTTLSLHEHAAFFCH